MRIKDETIIGMLILTWVFMVVIILGGETKFDKLTEQLKQLGEQQHEDIVEMQAELAEHEDRLYLVEHNYEVIKIRVNNHWQKLLDLQGMVVEHSERITKVERTAKEATRSKSLNLKIKQSEIRKIGSLVYLECGSCSTKCKRAVASVVFNRMIRYKKTVNQVLYEKGVFSVADEINRTTPSQSCIAAVKYVLKYGTTLPRMVTAFRNRRYHSFGKRYCCIDGVYFSLV